VAFQMPRSRYSIGRRTQREEPFFEKTARMGPPGAELPARRASDKIALARRPPNRLSGLFRLGRDRPIFRRCPLANRDSTPNAVVRHRGRQGVATCQVRRPRIASRRRTDTIPQRPVLRRCPSFQPRPNSHALPNFSVDAEFQKLVCGRSDVDLVQWLLELAAEHYPSLDRLGCLLELDRLGSLCRTAGVCRSDERRGRQARGD